MAVWHVFPTAAPIEQAKACIDAWHVAGYKVAISYIEPERKALPADAHVLFDSYPGLYTSINHLAKLVLKDDPACNVVVYGGDDTWPETRYPPEQIEREFIEHFAGTLGLMQPTGDEWPYSRDRDGTRAIDRVAASPWMGREWCLRAFGGVGPCWPEYHHYFGDAEVADVGRLLKLYWTRPDRAHRHENWKRRRPRIDRPQHLHKANEMWPVNSALYHRRKDLGFPGHDLLQA